MWHASGNEERDVTIKRVVFVRKALREDSQFSLILGA